MRYTILVPPALLAAALVVGGCAGTNATPSSSAPTPQCVEGTECLPGGGSETESNETVDTQALWDDYPSDGQRKACDYWSQSSRNVSAIDYYLRTNLLRVIARQKAGWGRATSIGQILYDENSNYLFDTGVSADTDELPPDADLVEMLDRNCP